MVLAGQYLERPAVIAAGDVALEGLYHRGARAPALLVCAAPGPGGGMDAPCAAELAWAAARAGHPSLRFQYRGVGASTGLADAAYLFRDAEAALLHLAETTRASAAVAALGAADEVARALAAARPDLEAVILIAPPRPLLAPAPRRCLVLLPEVGGPLGPEGIARTRAAGAQVEVIAGADASFRSGISALGRAAIEWIAGAV